MKRWLFNIAAGASLMFFLVAMSLWIRGFWVWESFDVNRSTERGDEIVTWKLSLASDCRQFMVGSRVQHDRLDEQLLAIFRARKSHLFFGHTSGRAEGFTLLPGDPTDPFWNRIGFEYFDSNDVIQTYRNYFDRSWGVPFWFPLALLSVLPILKIVGVTRARRLFRRQRLGLCRHCGFDLRATPDRCPECGTMAGRSATPQRS